MFADSTVVRGCEMIVSSVRFTDSTVVRGCEEIVRFVRFVDSVVVLVSVVRVDADASVGPAWAVCCTSRSANPINPKRKMDLNADVLMKGCDMEG